MGAVISFLFEVVIGALFHAFRLGLHWLLGGGKRTLGQAADDAVSGTARVWHRSKWETRLSGRELLIQLVAGVLTAATLFGIGYAAWRWWPAADQ